MNETVPKANLFLCPNDDSAGHHGHSDWTPKPTDQSSETTFTRHGLDFSLGWNKVHS